MNDALRDAPRDALRDAPCHCRRPRAAAWS